MTSSEPSTGSYFNPRSPWGERRRAPQLPEGLCRDFNPRSPWGERQGHQNRGSRPGIISIHAPRGGSDGITGISFIQHLKFQSTLPVGGATPQSACDIQRCSFQSTLPVGGATSSPSSPQLPRSISIHAPRGGSDLIQQDGKSVNKIFQSTLPVGGATMNSTNLTSIKKISIHAPRGGSDFLRASFWQSE